MFKLTAKFVSATNGGVRMANQALKTYTRYAYYSLTDKKGGQSQTASIQADNLYQPRYALSYQNAEDFVLSQWSNNAYPYAVYRTLVALYFIFMVFYTAIVGTLKTLMLVKLTYWSYYILAVCQIIRAKNVWDAIALKKEGKDVNKEWYNKKRIRMQWLLHTITVDSAILVTLLFWTIDYRGTGLNFINVNTHGVNAAYVFLDMLISRTPMRLLHACYPCAMGLVYCSFSIVYWMAGGINEFKEPYIYKALNYGEKPGVAAMYIVVIAFLVLPILHSMAFFLYRFRVSIHRFLKNVDRRKNKAIN